MEKQSLSKEIENYKEEPNETFRTNNAMTKKTLQKKKQKCLSCWAQQQWRGQKESMSLKIVYQKLPNVNKLQKVD